MKKEMKKEMKEKLNYVIENLSLFLFLCLIAIWPIVLGFAIVFCVRILAILTDIQGAVN